MKALLYWVVGSVVLCVGWTLFCGAVRWWKRRADELQQLYG